MLWEHRLDLPSTGCPALGHCLGVSTGPVCAAAQHKLCSLLLQPTHMVPSSPNPPFHYQFHQDKLQTHHSRSCHTALHNHCPFQWSLSTEDTPVFLLMGDTQTVANRESRDGPPPALLGDFSSSASKGDNERPPSRSSCSADLLHHPITCCKPHSHYFHQEKNCNQIHS